MKYYAVIDTNVLVSALLTHQKESATAQILDLITDGKIIPVYSDAIIQEYWEVLKRKKFHFAHRRIREVLESIIRDGVSIEPTPTGERLPDMKDLPFYEVVMEKRVDDAYLVTGNIKHFPKRTYIVTARQMLDILNSYGYSPNIPEN